MKNEPMSAAFRRPLCLLLAVLTILVLLPASAALAAEEVSEQKSGYTEPFDAENAPAANGAPEGTPASTPVPEPVSTLAPTPEPEPDDSPAPEEPQPRIITGEDGNRYCIDPDGSLHTGWLHLDGKWYYFWKSGVMATGWCMAGDGYWYYFEKDTGEVHYGWATCAGKTYYMRPEDGTEQKGWRKIDGYWYYFWSNGVMATGWCYTNDNCWYYFDKETGIVHRGWATSNGNWYYMRPEDARKQTYWREIDGWWYYFGGDGVMRTGWQFIGGEYYYFYTGWEDDPGPVGANAHDVTIDGRYVQSGGYIKDGAKVFMKERAAQYSSATNYLLVVDTTTCKTGVFYGSRGNWDLWYFWDCAPGKASTPTVKGSFTVQSKGYFFDSYGARCFWYTQFYGNYLFHSITYYPDGSVMDARLGMPLSHGCVRLAYDNAYWIYKNIPAGTKVVVY